MTERSATAAPMSLAAPYSPAPRPRTADCVLFLDYDGVLHHEEVYLSPKRGVYMCQKKAPGRSLFEWVHHLEAALAPYPEVAIVISSTWCVHPGYGRAKKRLPQLLQDRCIGGTFHRRVHGADPWLLQNFKSTARGMQVWADVARRQPKQWLALDDDTFGWPAWARENLVPCDGARGLSDPAVRAQLATKLQACHEALATLM